MRKGSHSPKDIKLQLQGNFFKQRGKVDALIVGMYDIGEETDQKTFTPTELKDIGRAPRGYGGLWTWTVPSDAIADAERCGFIEPAGEGYKRYQLTQPGITYCRQIREELGRYLEKFNSASSEKDMIQNAIIHVLHTQPHENEESSGVLKAALVRSVRSHLRQQHGLMFPAEKIEPVIDEMSESLLQKKQEIVIYDRYSLNEAGVKAAREQGTSLPSVNEAGAKK